MADRVRSPALRLQFFLKRKPSMTVEEFHSYWQGKHAEFALNLPGFKELCMRYVQIHCFPELQNQAKRLGIRPLDYDGMAELSIQDVGEFSKSVTKRATLKAIMDEMELFLHSKHSAVMIGTEQVIWDGTIPDAHANANVDSKAKL